MSAGEERYQIRALSRALTILRVLNQHNGLNASELSRMVKLPRPTVLRLLTTLSDNGYVLRCEADASFRASRKVRELSDGYRAREPRHQIARDYLAVLEQEVVWPLAVVTMEGDSLVVDALTDHGSRVAPRRDSAGRDLPLLVSASAYLFLAYANEAERDRLLRRAFDSEAAAMAAAGLTREDVLAHIAHAAECGHAVLHLDGYSSLSVPVVVDGTIACALNVRLHASMQARRERVESLIPVMKNGAAELARRFLPEARPLH